MDYSLLKDVTNELQEWVVRVRLTRFTEYEDETDLAKKQALDMVMIDEETTMMDAQVPRDHQLKFDKDLQEDLVYYVKDFEVTAARKNYRPVEGPFRARFTGYTGLTLIDPVLDTYPLYAYKIAPLDELHNRIDIRSLLSDTIAIVTCIHPITYVKNGLKAMRKINMLYESTSMDLTLWS